MLRRTRLTQALLTPKLGGGFQVTRGLQLTSSHVAVESCVVAPSVFFTVLGDVFLTSTFKCGAF